MTSLFYLALTDGTTTIELTDGINFSVSDESGWLPNVAFDSEQRTVVDSIPINILGALTSGGRSQGGRTRVNYIKLLTMLRQIERGQQGDGGVVTLVYTSPNSAPARRIACQVTRWDPSTFPADVSSVINLPQHEINEVVLTLEHRVPWVWQSYPYTNMLASSAWSTTPTPIGASGTVAYGAIAGYYGGAGQITLTKTSGALAAMYSNSITITVATFDPITVTFSYGRSAGLSAITFNLIASGSFVAHSNTVTFTTAQAPAATITEGRRITATITPTVLGVARLYWGAVGGAAADTLTIAEVFAHETAEETWHPDTSLEGVGVMTPATAAIPTVYTATFPNPQTSAAPVTIMMNGIPATGLTTGMGRSLLAATDGVIEVVNLPVSTGGVFSSVNEAAKIPLGNTILRYTPAIANTWSQQALAAVISPNRASFYLVARNNSLTTTFLVRILGFVSSPSPYIYTREIVIPPYTGAAKPDIYQLGAIYSQSPLLFFLEVQANAAAGTLDMDRIGIIEETEYTNVITTTPIASTGSIGGQYIVQDRWLTAPQTRVIGANGGALSYLLSSPDATLIKHRGATLRTVFDAVTFSGDWWRSTDDSATPIAPIPSVTRPPAFDAPL